MLAEKVGEFAGLVWNALNASEAGLNAKDLKKATKLKKNEEIFMALGWLLREDKINAVETEEDVVYSLK
ncbi:MAG: winged helix-turn-helix domain-containing protein [Bacteroidaceae bacterium]|nr:winged helix-turn-helix domain-containing protein [Bacteroidaceae bacterium]MBO4590178.1 winged helix-turn-helix domain-containing protein [Bacteroidaceae bacterium]MBR5963928.1 winged helix-turn-helix domain-containing protein [Bacteroidaceae bacterium]